MKILFENYSFNPLAKTVTLNTTNTVTLEQLLIITNVSTNTIVYNFADPSTGGTISNNILTLDYNTTGMSSTDKLQIFLDNTLTPASEESIQYLKKIAQLVAPLSTQDSLQRLRVNVEATANIATISTVSNLVNLSGVDARFQFVDQARNAYANGVRNNLSFN